MIAKTYSAMLRGDRLEWTGEAPAPADPGRSISVTVVVPDDAEAAPGLASGGRDPDRWQAAVAALKRLADRGTFADIADPVQWQREIREDRPMPGRVD